jgi:hypothetical protein
MKCHDCHGHFGEVSVRHGYGIPGGLTDTGHNLVVVMTWHHRRMQIVVMW